METQCIPTSAQGKAHSNMTIQACLVMRYATFHLAPSQTICVSAGQSFPITKFPASSFAQPEPQHDFSKVSNH